MIPTNILGTGRKKATVTNLFSSNLFAFCLSCFRIHMATDRADRSVPPVATAETMAVTCEAVEALRKMSYCQNIVLHLAFCSFDSFLLLYPGRWVSLLSSCRGDHSSAAHVPLTCNLDCTWRSTGRRILARSWSRWCDRFRELQAPGILQLYEQTWRWSLAFNYVYSSTRPGSLSSQKTW